MDLKNTVEKPEWEEVRVIDEDDEPICRNDLSRWLAQLTSFTFIAIALMTLDLYLNILPFSKITQSDSMLVIDYPDLVERLLESLVSLATGSLGTIVTSHVGIFTSKNKVFKFDDSIFKKSDSTNRESEANQQLTHEFNVPLTDVPCKSKLNQTLVEMQTKYLVKVPEMARFYLKVLF